MKNRRYLFLIIIFLSSLGSAQAQYNPDKVSKKALQLNAKAMALSESYDLKGAIDILKQAVKLDPQYEEAWLSIAGMYGELKNYPAAIENYEKAKSIDSTFFIDYNLP